MSIHTNIKNFGKQSILLNANSEVYVKEKQNDGELNSHFPPCGRRGQKIPGLKAYLREKINASEMHTYRIKLEVTQLRY